MGEATSGRTSERRGPSEAEALAMARELAGPVLGPKRAARMRVVAVGEVVRAQLDESLESLGLLSDETVSRERRILRARYQLVDLSSGAIVLDATAGSDAGIDVVSSDYATIAAERASAERLAEVVADQIVTRVSLALRRRN